MLNLCLHLEDKYQAILNQATASWEDVALMDETREIMKVGTAILKYLASRPQESLATVERRLRTENRFTHLIATPQGSDIPPGAKVANAQGKECLYNLFITTLDLEKAMEQRRTLAVHPDPEKNLEDLEETGVLQIDNFAHALIAVGQCLKLDQAQSFYHFLNQINKLSSEEKDSLYEKINKEEAKIQVSYECLLSVCSQLGVDLRIVGQSFSDILLSSDLLVVLTTFIKAQQDKQVQDHL